MKKQSLIFLFVIVILILSGCQAQANDETGFFHQYVISPFSTLIFVLAEFFNGNFGLSIVLLTLIIRLLLVPFMLKQHKNQAEMKEKMEEFKPELDAVQQKMKETKDPEKQKALQQEMLGLYQKHGINPLASMGCLPLLIQMPILMGFYYAIISSEEIARHSFLWFSLGKADIFLTAIAGLIYFLQAKVAQNGLPSQQQKQMKMMLFISPILITIISLNAPAVLPLYWSVGGIFLIGQTLLAQKLYHKGKVPNQTTSTDQA